MKLVKTEESVGQVLCHDMTQIIPGKTKGPRFKKGHVVKPEDVPVLLSMGKVHLYVFELEEGMVHEDDAAERLAALCAGANTSRLGAPAEGKITIYADCEGVLIVDSKRLAAVNAVPDVMVASRRGGFAVKAGDRLAGTRVIPLVVPEQTLVAAEEAAAGEPLLRVEPWKLRSAAVIATGSEVAGGLIQDRFTPVIVDKLAPFGINVTERVTPGDVMEDVTAAISAAVASGVDMVVCTGGMSVDPDDNTPGAIRRAGARIVSYGAPVLPGNMMLVSYLAHEGREVPVLGVPGCAMYSRATILDLLLPRLVAGVPITREDLDGMGEGGLCLDCPVCVFPHCEFGR